MNLCEKRPKRKRKEGEDERGDGYFRLVKLVEQQQYRIEQLEKLVMPTKQLQQLSPRLFDHEPTRTVSPVYVQSTASLTPALSGTVDSEVLELAGLQPVKQPAHLREPKEPSLYTDTHQRLEDTFRRLETNLSLEDLADLEADEDLLIRCVVYGWDAAARKYHLDTVWRFLRMFDQHVYRPMDKVARLAALRALRNMLIHKIRPVNQPIREIPSFFAPTALQQMCEHPSMADYFAWPVVRDYFVSHQYELRSAPKSAHTTFAMHFHFDWPHDLRDAYRTSRSSNRLTFSKEFNDRFNELNCWQVNFHDGVSLIPAQLRPELLTPRFNCPFNLTLAKETTCPRLDSAPLRAGPDSPDPASASDASRNHRLFPFPSAAGSPQLEASLDEALAAGADETMQRPTTKGHPSEDWAWALDTPNPEFALSVRSLLEVAMPL